MINETTKLKVAGIVGESVVDGLGIRMTLFVQGCPHRCKGCHNAHTHDPEGGNEMTIEEIARMVIKNPLLDGMTFSGGEPFMQPKPLAELASWLKSCGLNVWCYSGYTLEQLQERSKEDGDTARLLKLIDVLVDGPYIEEKKDLTLRFRGSSNQRVIDMATTRASGKVVLLLE